MNTTSTAIQVLRKDGSKLPEVLGVLHPAISGDVPEEHEVAKPVKVSDEVRAVAKELAAVKATPLTVTERRALTQDEIDTLSIERERLDKLDKYIKSRKEAMRVMLMNHWDVEVEASGVKADLDDKRHYLTAEEAPRTDGSKKWVRQLSEGSPSVTADDLRDVVSEDGFSHEDYLACTTQVRVLDEEKTLIHMRSNPEVVVEALRQAAQPGRRTASVYHR